MLVLSSSEALAVEVLVLLLFASLAIRWRRRTILCPYCCLLVIMASTFILNNASLYQFLSWL
jgi:hypothetical protein